MASPSGLTSKTKSMDAFACDEFGAEENNACREVRE